MGRKAIEAKRADIISAWNEGKTIFEICALVEIETTPIRKVLKEAMAESKLTRPYETRQGNTLSRLRNLIAVHPQGTWTINQYAEVLGVSETTVESYLFRKKDKEGNLVIGWKRPAHNELGTAEIKSLYKWIDDGISIREINERINTELRKNLNRGELENMIRMYQFMKSSELVA